MMEKMSGGSSSSSRGSLRPHGAARSNSFVVIGLLVVITILGFNYWNAMKRNNQLTLELFTSKALVKKTTEELQSFQAEKKYCEQKLTKRDVELEEYKRSAVNTKAQLDKLNAEVSQLHNELQSCQQKTANEKSNCDQQISQEKEKCLEEVSGEKDECKNKMTAARKECDDAKAEAEQNCRNQMEQECDTKMQKLQQQGSQQRVQQGVQQGSQLGSQQDAVQKTEQKLGKGDEGGQRFVILNRGGQPSAQNNSADNRPQNRFNGQENVQSGQEQVRRNSQRDSRNEIGNRDTNQQQVVQPPRVIGDNRPESSNKDAEDKVRGSTESNKTNTAADSVVRREGAPQQGVRYLNADQDNKPQNNFGRRTDESNKPEESNQAEPPKVQRNADEVNNGERVANNNNEEDHKHEDHMNRSPEKFEDNLAGKRDTRNDIRGNDGGNTVASGSAVGGNLNRPLMESNIRANQNKGNEPIKMRQDGLQGPMGGQGGILGAPGGDRAAAGARAAGGERATGGERAAGSETAAGGAPGDDRADAADKEDKDDEHQEEKFL